MNRSDSPFVADWFVISLRWLVLLGVIVSLSAAGQLFVWVNLLLVFLTLWNITLTWLAGLNQRLPQHRHVSVAVDVVVTSLFFWFQGGITGPAFWICILPLISGGLYFDLSGGLIAGVAMGLVNALDIVFHGIQILPRLLFGGLTIGMGLFFGYISQQVIRQLRVTREQQVAVREHQQRIETDRMRAIFKVTSTLTATLNYKRVLDSALDLSVSALHVDDVQSDKKTPMDDRLISAFLLFKDEQLIVGSSRRFTSADHRLTFPAKTGILAKSIEEGESVLTGSVASDPELKSVMGLQSCQSVYCLPLRVGLSTYGALIFGHPQPNYFAPDRCDVLSILAQQATIAIQNARLYQDLADEKEHMAEAQEEARKKLARDLHDGPTQSVAAIAMRVNLVRRMLERDPKSVMDELEKIEDLARRTTKEIRHMLFTLRPLVLESQGLVAALQAMADKMKETFGQEVVIQVNQKLADDLEMGKKGIIFYLAEEAINNARKHAQSPQIFVRLATVPKEPEIAWLQIADNGVGFDVQAVTATYDQRGSLGMVNLHERTELINGLLQIDSAPGKGTRVNVYIPLSEEAADKLHHGRAHD